MPFVFPTASAAPTVVTKEIKQAMSRLMAVHQPRGQLVVLTGKAGAGKTTAGLHIRDEIEAAYQQQAPNAFRAAYYVAADIRRSRGDLLQRRLLAEFSTQVLQLTVNDDLRTLVVSKELRRIATGLRLQNIQVVIIDEAGHLPPDAFDHLCTLLNTTATAEQHALTIVLIGMHELPASVSTLPQVRRRVAEFVHFAPFDAATVMEVLRHMHPYFETLDPVSAEATKLLTFLMSPEVSDGGLIGLIVPLVERAIQLSGPNFPFGPRAIRTAYAIKDADAGRGHSEMQRGWNAGTAEQRGSK